MNLQEWLAEALGPEPLIDWLRPLAYLGLALLYGLLAQSPQTARWCQRNTLTGWRLLCPTYLLAASSSLLHGDQLFVHWARAQAHALHLYELRRWFQGATLLAAGMLGLALLRLRAISAARAAALRSWAARSIGIGLATTVLLFALRYISFHYTDRVLDFTLLGHSTGTWLELVALALPLAGTWMEFTQRYEPV